LILYYSNSKKSVAKEQRNKSMKARDRWGEKKLQKNKEERVDMKILWI
jgi:hypothetical protein